MLSMRRLIPALLLLGSLTAFAQHDHHMQMVSRAKLESRNDAATHTLTVRLGPIDLPANTSHDQLQQPAPQAVEIPFDGWITAYHPAMVLADGRPTAATRVLHHVAFWNTSRPDFLCTNKEEHIFGAGGEMNDWPALPGFGYRVHKGDRIRVTTMFHNPTSTPYAGLYLQVKMEYATADAGLKSVYPAWFDVKECGESDFPLHANGTVEKGAFTLNYSGRLLGVGGHMHDYGQQLMLSVAKPEQAANKQQPDVIASLVSKLDGEGHILSIPIVTFFEGGGYPLVKGEKVEVVVNYGKPRMANADGMGIVVGYFLPDNDADMASLTKKN